MTRILVLLFTLVSSTYAAAESIAVKYWGELNLKPFTCTDISRSSFINRVCFDEKEQFMVIQLRGTYYPYCEMPKQTLDTFMTASSMGKFYNANIKGSGKDGPYDCRTHRKPTYPAG
jgi:hypothetical protein